MIKVTVDLHIQRSAKDVFDFLSNMVNNPLWQDGMETCQIIDNLPLRVGQEYLQIAHFLGKEIKSHFKIIEFEPDYLVKATTLESSFPITFTRTVSGDDNRCHVVAYIEGDPKGFFKVIEPALERMVYKRIHRDYYHLKDLMEKSKE